MTRTEPWRHRRRRSGPGRVIRGMLAVVAVALTISLGGCGVGTAHYAKGGAARVESRAVEGVGAVLASGDGRLLYAFEPDHARKVSCTGFCTMDWPPYALAHGSTVRAGSGVDAAQLSTMPNPGGGRVVTYRGWPLYTFAGDGASGRAKGQGKDAYGGRWHVMTTSGPLRGTA